MTTTRFEVLNQILKQDRKSRINNRVLDIDSIISNASQTFFHPNKNIKQTGEIFELIDHCFEEIFEYLPPEVLATLSTTCSSVRKLVKAYFRRVHAGKQIEITRFYPNVVAKNYTELQEIIENVWLHGIHKPHAYLQHLDNEFAGENFDLLLYYIHSACNKHPKCIRFENMELSQQYGEMLNETLKTAETVEIINCDVQNTYDGFLKRAENLENLTMDLRTAKEGSAAWSTYENFEAVAWLTQPYTKLKHLSIRFSDPTKYQLLKHFFESNPQILRFTCRSYLLSYVNVVLTAIANYTYQLEEMSITISEECDIIPAVGSLLTVCRRPSFKHLTLQFDNEAAIFINNINNMTHLTKLKVLIINNMSFQEENFLREFLPLTSLTELHLKSLVYGKKNVFAKMLVKLAPNLERVYIKNTSFFAPGDIDFIQPFVASSPKLNKFVIQDYWHRINDELVDLNGQRQKLEGACVLNIWLYASIIECTTTERKITGKTLIKLRRLKYDNCVDVRFCRVKKNPL